MAFRIRKETGEIATVEEKPPELTHQAMIGGQLTWVTEVHYQGRLAFEREQLAKEVQLELPEGVTIEPEVPEWVRAGYRSEGEYIEAQRRAAQVPVTAPKWARAGFTSEGAYREAQMRIERARLDEEAKYAKAIEVEVARRAAGEPKPAVLTEITEEIVPSGGPGEARIITTRVTTPTEVREEVVTRAKVPKYYDPATGVEVAAPKPGVTYAIGTVHVTKSEWEATPEPERIALRSEYDIEIRPDKPKVKEAIVVHIKPKQFLETEESYQRRLSAKEGYIAAKKAGDVRAAELFGKEMRTARQTLYGVTAEKYEAAAKVTKDELTKRLLLGMAGAAKGIEITLERPLSQLIKLPGVIAADPLKFITELPQAPRKFVSSIGVAFGAPPIPEPFPPKFITDIPIVGVRYAPIRTISLPSGLVTEAMERTIEEWAPATAFDPSLEMAPVLRGLGIAGEIAGAILISTATLKIMKKGVEVGEKALKTLKVDVKTGLGRAAKKALTKTKQAVKSAEKAEKKKVKTIKITKKMIEEGLPLEETGISERVPYTIDEIKTLMKYQPSVAKKLLADIIKTTKAGYNEMLELKEFAKAESYRRGLMALEELVKEAVKVKPVFVEPGLLVSVEPSVITKVSPLVAAVAVSRVGELSKSTVSTKTSTTTTSMLKTTLLPRVKVKEKVKVGVAVLTLQEQLQEQSQLQKQMQEQTQKQAQLSLLAQAQLQKKAQAQLLGQSQAVTTMLKKKEKEEEKVIVLPYEESDIIKEIIEDEIIEREEDEIIEREEDEIIEEDEITEEEDDIIKKKEIIIQGLPWRLPRPGIIRRRVPIREALKPKGEYAPSITAVYERITVRKPLKQTIFSPFDIRPVITKEDKEEEKKRKKRLLARAKVRDILKPSLTGKPSKVVAGISLKPSIIFGEKPSKKKAPARRGVRDILKPSIKAKPSKVVARISLKPSIKLGGKAPKKGGIMEALKPSIKF